MVNEELENTWKESVTAQFEVLTQHMPGDTEENHENIQLRQSDSRQDSNLANQLIIQLKVYERSDTFVNKFIPSLMS